VCSRLQLADCLKHSSSAECSHRQEGFANTVAREAAVCTEPACGRARPVSAASSDAAVADAAVQQWTDAAALDGLLETMTWGVDPPLVSFIQSG